MQSIKALVIKISLVLFKCLYNDYMSCQRYSNMVKCLWGTIVLQGGLTSFLKNGGDADGQQKSF